MSDKNKKNSRGYSLSKLLYWVLPFELDEKTGKLKRIKKETQPTKE